jgi:nitrile hydratase accessory protein
MSVAAAVAVTEGIPRANGELVFTEPWEARAFGIAIALCERRGLDWEEFRGRLIAEIGAWEAAHGAADDGWSYYERWLAALERLVIEHGLVAPAEIAARSEEFAHHDAHDHDHDHHH